MAYFPIFIELNQKKCLVIGGGKVALRKTKVLLEYGANVMAIAPKWEEEFEELEKKYKEFRKVTNSFERKGERKQTLQIEDVIKGKKYKLVIAATNCRKLNEQIAICCKKNRILVNVADQKELCTFLFPAVVHREPVSVGITTSGNSPVASAFLREQIETLVDDEFLQLLGELTALREHLKKTEKKEEKRRKIIREYQNKWKENQGKGSI